MINTTTPTAVAEESQVADKPATKKSPATKPRAAKSHTLSQKLQKVTGRQKESRRQK